MPIRVALAVVAMTVGIVSASAAPVRDMTLNEDLAPLKGRVGINVKNGHLQESLLACPEPGSIRLILKDNDPVRAGNKAAGWGCFDLSRGDKIEIVDRMPLYDKPASHLCVMVSPHQRKCVWILNVGIKAD